MTNHIDYQTRAQTETPWNAAAEGLGWLIDDPDENGNGKISAPGVDLSLIGSVVVVPAIYDENGNLITPVVMDDRYHVNVRLDPAKWAHQSDLMGEAKTENVPSSNQNKNEQGWKYRSMTFIDPATFASPINIWLGD